LALPRPGQLTLAAKVLFLYYIGGFCKFIKPKKAGKILKRTLKMKKPSLRILDKRPEYELFYFTTK
jgi:hypothetical protein